MFQRILIVFSILVYCESVHIFQKCPITDGTCKSALYRGIIRSMAAGIPDKNIPPLDPIEMSEVTVDLPDTTKLITSKGELLGMKDCSFDHMHTELRKKELSETNIILTCQIKITGDFQVKGGPDSFDGNGKGEINFTNVKVKAQFRFYVTKHDDGEVYLASSPDKITHTFEAPEDIKVKVDDFGLGEKNAKMLSCLQKNSDLIKEKLLPEVLNKSLEFYDSFVINFLGTVPMKTFVNTNLDPYIQ